MGRASMMTTIKAGWLSRCGQTQGFRKQVPAPEERGRPLGCTERTHAGGQEKVLPTQLCPHVGAHLAQGPQGDQAAPVTFVVVGAELAVRAESPPVSF